jgi:hypothetical protein
MHRRVIALVSSGVNLGTSSTIEAKAQGSATSRGTYVDVDATNAKTPTITQALKQELLEIRREHLKGETANDDPYHWLRFLMSIGGRGTSEVALFVFAADPNLRLPPHPLMSDPRESLGSIRLSDGGEVTLYMPGDDLCGWFENLAYAAPPDTLIDPIDILDEFVLHCTTVSCVYRPKDRETIVEAAAKRWFTDNPLLNIYRPLVERCVEWSRSRNERFVAFGKARMDRSPVSERIFAELQKSTSLPTLGLLRHPPGDEPTVLEPLWRAAKTSGFAKRSITTPRALSEPMAAAMKRCTTGEGKRSTVALDRSQSVPPEGLKTASGDQSETDARRTPGSHDTEESPKDPVELPDLVTLDQAAAAVHKSKRTLERRKTKGTLPDPIVEGGGGQSALYDWNLMGPWLTETFGVKLPEKFFANRI